MGDPIPPSEPGLNPIEGQTMPPHSIAEPAAYSPVPEPAAGGPIPEPAAKVETPKPVGMLERVRAAQKGFKDARDNLKALELESYEILDGIHNDSEVLFMQADEVLRQVNPDKTHSSEPHDTIFDVPIPVKDQILYSDRDAKGRVTVHREFSDGVFVGADGKSIAVTNEMVRRTFEAVDPNDTEAVRAALEQSNKPGSSSELVIQDPGNPTLKLILKHYSHEFFIIKPGASGEKWDWDASVRVSSPWSEERAAIEFSEGSEQIIGDPFEIARRTLDFAKSATLKPIVVGGQAPTAPSTPPAPTV